MITSERVVEMFEVDSADMSAEKSSAGLAFADHGARTRIGLSGNLRYICYCGTAIKVNYFEVGGFKLACVILFEMGVSFELPNPKLKLKLTTGWT
jgi:hypothetical protein